MLEKRGISIDIHATFDGQVETTETSETLRGNFRLFHFRIFHQSYRIPWKRRKRGKLLLVRSDVSTFSTTWRHLMLKISRENGSRLTFLLLFFLLNFELHLFIFFTLCGCTFYFENTKLVMMAHYVLILHVFLRKPFLKFLNVLRVKVP